MLGRNYFLLTYIILFSLILMIKVGNNSESLASQRKDAIRVDFDQVRELITHQKDCFLMKGNGVECHLA